MCSSCFSLCDAQRLSGFRLLQEQSRHLSSAEWPLNNHWAFRIDLSLAGNLTLDSGLLLLSRMCGCESDPEGIGFSLLRTVFPEQQDPTLLFFTVIISLSRGFCCYIVGAGFLCSFAIHCKIDLHLFPPKSALEGCYVSPGLLGCSSMQPLA